MEGHGYGERGGYRGRDRGGGGRGRGRGRGRGGREQNQNQYQYQYHQQQTQGGRDGQPWDSAVPDRQLPEIIPSLSVLKVSDKFVPPKRPDKGGALAIWSVRLLVNHFPVNYDPNTIIGHYDIDIQRESTSRNGRLAKVSKSDLCMIREKLFSDCPNDFPMAMTAYDGEKNVFSAIPLPVGTYKVEISDGDDRTTTYNVAIKHVSDLEVRKLKDYFCSKVLSVPRDILQGMDIVMKENPARQMISIGRHFHPWETDPRDDLGGGIAASRGFQHSLKPTSQGLAMCLDYSVLAIRKHLPVIKFLEQHINGFNIGNFRSFREKVETVLKELKVSVTHRRTKQKFSIVGLSDKDTRFVDFDLQDPSGQTPPKRVFLVDYFSEKYGVKIQHLNIPCLDLGKNNKQNFVPMEFCVLVEGQRYPKDDLGNDAGLMLKRLSLAPPPNRKKIICDMVRASSGPFGGDVSRNFGIQVDASMTRVTGRVIAPPQLKFGSPNGGFSTLVMDPRNCQWNLVDKQVVEGRPIDQWAVLDFSAGEGNRRLNPNQFIPKLIRRCEKLGIRIKRDPHYVTASMRVFRNAHMLRECIDRVITQARQKGMGNLQILICVMSRKDNGYKTLKWICETEMGLVTQCCLSGLANEAKDQYLANLAMKINAKLGGSNVELIERLPRFESVGYVMFIGADVNHPAPRNKTCPSIAAVVATVNWPAATRYAARLRPQEHRKESISNFGEMCLELVDTYARINGRRPESVLVFRDGVSESQSNMVLNDELLDLKRVFVVANYFPTITVIVARKRHQTRLFLESGSGNVPPGTVVDTTIIHPFEFDFYLCSHQGIIGTSKPTHYHVLWDEHGFTSDQLQTVIYNLCFTFARCTKPVSLVPPVYYADLVAYRGRMFQEALIEGQSPVSASSSSSARSYSSSSSAIDSFDERFYKLHGDLSNEMFFV
ncbi:Protein argonaute, N-terminal [Dillenia turbinata]|uniref:Protein argonaute, N-terminal n=1 Tax=Dillenia turbinata TaxID=194707 RepID=A0AAN8VEA3_9MAGN